MNSDVELERLADTYRSQGYDVTVRPGPEQLPAFARDFRVEILARRGAGGVLVTAKRNREELAEDGRAPWYAEVTGAQPGWRFDLAVLEGDGPRAQVERDLRGAAEFTPADIGQTVAQAAELSRLGFPRVAVIHAWAGFEAAMRLRLRALGQDAGPGAAPRQMLSELYSAGAFSPTEFRHLEAASQLRNQLAHGFLPRTLAPGASEGDTVPLLNEVARRLVLEANLIVQPA